MQKSGNTKPGIRQSATKPENAKLGIYQKAQKSGNAKSGIRQSATKPENLKLGIYQKAQKSGNVKPGIWLGSLIGLVQ